MSEEEAIIINPYNDSFLHRENDSVLSFMLGILFLSVKGGPKSEFSHMKNNWHFLQEGQKPLLFFPSDLWNFFVVKYFSIIFSTRKPSFIS